MAEHQVKAHFDGIGDGYLDQVPLHVREHLISKWWNLVVPFLPEKASVLDVGCGDGTNVKFMRDKGLEAIGLDFSTSLLESGRKRYPELESVLFEGDALALAFDSGTFDAVSMIGVLHHIPSREGQKRTISEAVRVVRDGGHVVIRESNLRNPLFRIFWNYVFPMTAKIDRFGGENWIAPAALHGMGFPPAHLFYFTFIPSFVPACLLPYARRIEERLERGVARSYAAHYIAVLKK